MASTRKSSNPSANLVRRLGVELPPLDATGYAEVIRDALEEVAFITRHVGLPPLRSQLGGLETNELRDFDDFTLASRVFKFARMIVNDQEHEFYLSAPNGVKIIHITLGMHSKFAQIEKFDVDRWDIVLSEVFELMGQDVRGAISNPTLKTLETINDGLGGLIGRREDEIRRVKERQPAIKEMIVLARALRPITTS